jgi:hypothetical protein
VPYIPQYVCQVCSHSCEVTVPLIAACQSKKKENESSSLLLPFWIFSCSGCINVVGHDSHLRNLSRAGGIGTWQDVESSDAPRTPERNQKVASAAGSGEHMSCLWLGLCARWRYLTRTVYRRHKHMLAFVLLWLKGGCQHMRPGGATCVHHDAHKSQVVAPQGRGRAAVPCLRSVFVACEPSQTQSAPSCSALSAVPLGILSSAWHRVSVRSPQTSAEITKASLLLKVH